MDGVAADPRYLDVSVPPGRRKTLPVATERHAFAYVFEGDGTLRQASQPLRALTEKAGEDNETLVRERTGNRSLVLFDTAARSPVQAGENGIPEIPAGLRQADRGAGHIIRPDDR